MTGSQGAGRRAGAATGDSEDRGPRDRVSPLPMPTAALGGHRAGGRWTAHGLLGAALAGRALVGHLTLPLLVVLEGPGFLPLLVARPSEDPGRRRRPDQ